MKKFLIALLAALLVVGMFTVAMADEPYPSEAANGTDKALACQYCGGVLELKVIPLSGVYYGDECTSDRYEVYVCSYCNKVAVGYGQKKVAPAPGHQLDLSKRRIEKGATCDTTGVMYAPCVVCGKEILITDPTIAAGHTWDKGTVIKAAKCNATGVIKYQCTVCGVIKDVETPATKTHKFDLDHCDVVTKANCEKNGTYGGYCLECGEYFEYDPNIKGTEVLLIKARGHKFNDGVVTKQVTCQKDGEIVYQCSNYKATYEYEPCTEIVVKILGHNELENNKLTHTTISKYHKLVEVVVKPATETEWGIHFYKCTNAGCTYASEQTAYKLDPKPAVVEPTVEPTKPADTKPADTKPSKPSNTTNSKGVSIPKTNDTTSNLPYVLIAVAFVGLVALVASKRKVNG